MSLKRLVRRMLRAVGIDVARLGRYLLFMPVGDVTPERTAGADPLERFMLERCVAHVLHRLDVNCVLDVGANEGHYGLMLRRIGYRGYIVSFEPVPEAFALLEQAARGDAKWTTHRLALGADSTRARIHVTSGTDFSSFLAPTAFAVERFPASATVTRAEDVDMRRLDHVLDSLIAHIPRPRLFLKTDTQGYDLQVLAGAVGALDRMLGIQAEVAAVPLYDGTTLMMSALEIYRSHGFEVSGLFPVVHDRDTARVLEFDCVMVRAAPRRGDVPARA